MFERTWAETRDLMVELEGICVERSREASERGGNLSTGI